MLETFKYIEIDAKEATAPRTVHITELLKMKIQTKLLGINMLNVLLSLASTDRKSSKL